jgi:short-subunit dehydrogenase
MPTALVTGGTAGIGAAFARALAARGYDLVLVARTADRLEQSARELRASGREVEVLVADLAHRADVERVAARLGDQARAVDLLVNNAGFGLHSKLAAPDLAEHDRAFDVMVRSLLVLSAAVIPGMRARGHGRIINVASIAGQLPMGAYSAIKAWATVFSESLAGELAGTGISVTALLPGWVHTEFHERAHIRKSSIPGWLWLDADYLVAVCLRDAERGRAVSNPSGRYKTLSFFLRHLPRATVRAVARGINRSRRATLTE